MMRKLITSAVLIASLSGFVNAQTVHVPARVYATDLWGALFDPDHTITFTGRITGIEKVKPKQGNDTEVTLLVRKSDGNGTFIVDLGPSWYVDHQVAKVKVGTQVQVTGTKAMVDRRGMIVSSQIVLNGKGGLVLALRRPNGKAYWIGTEVAQNQTPPTGPNVVTGTVTGFQGYTLNNVDYQSAIVQTPAGPAMVDLGPTWYYGYQNAAINVGDGVTVVTGSNAFMIGPNMQIWPTYSIYNGPNIYNLRNSNGAPLYYWSGNQP